MTQTKLPVPPGVVMRVTQAAADPRSSAGNLARIIEQDPVLSAQVIKAVNSPLYSPVGRISNIQRAVGYMGINAVRNLVLCLAIREIFPQGLEFPLERFWECSLRRAVAGRCLGAALSLRQKEELFTVCLCQDLGVLVLVQEQEGLAAVMAEQLNLPAMQRLVAEQAVGTTHPEVGHAMFAEWNFPEELAEPVRYHHHPQEAPEEHRLMAQAACTAEALADLLEVEDKQASLAHAEDQLALLGIPPEQLQTLLDEVSAGVQDAAEILQIKVGKQPTYEEITMLASQGLVAISMDLQAQTADLQRSLQEQQRHTEKLQNINEELSEQASTDSLTSVANRRAFDETLALRLQKARQKLQPLALCMLDVDHFKRFNDTHGHQAGDKVLQRVALVMTEAVRERDYPARYGGEEFSVIMPGLGLRDAAMAADKLRRAIEQMRVDFKGKKLKVTVSIGVAAVPPAGPLMSPADVVRKADAALYKAKEHGRNRVMAG